MALTRDDPTPAGGAGTDAQGIQPSDAPQASSDEPGARPATLVAAEPRDLTQPIVVPNTLWSATEPEAYGGGAADRAHPPRPGSSTRTSSAATTPAGARSRSSRPRPTSSST